MNHRLYQFLCYIMIFFSAPLSAYADQNDLYLDRELNMKMGESIQLEHGLGFIKFIKVLEDSRCPVNVTCIWAGNVKTEFEIIDRDRRKYKIHLNNTVKPNELLLKGYSLQMISILPEKLKGALIAVNKYQVKLRIQSTTRKQAEPGNL